MSSSLVSGTFFNGENSANEAICWISIPNELTMHIVTPTAAWFSASTVWIGCTAKLGKKIFWCHALSLKQKSGMRLGNIAVDVLICFKFQGYLEPVFSIQSLINIWKDGGKMPHTGRPLDFPRGFILKMVPRYHFYRFKRAFPKCWIKFPWVSVSPTLCRSCDGFRLENRPT